MRVFGHPELATSQAYGDSVFVFSDPGEQGGTTDELAPAKADGRDRRAALHTP